MISIELKLPTSNSQTLLILSRAFIALLIIVVVDLLWDSIRGNCHNKDGRSTASWIQIIASWFILSVIIALQLPKNMKTVIIFASFIGLLIGAVSTLHDDPHTNVGSYIGDILQSLSITLAAAAGVYITSKALRLYPKPK